MYSNYAQIKIGKIAQMASELYYYYNFSLQNFNFGNDTLELMIYLQFNSYCKKIVKFLMKYTLEEYDTIFKNIVEGLALRFYIK